MSLADRLSAAFAGREAPAAVPVASAAVLVGHDEVVAAWGADTGTLFQATSISKPVAALMTLRLAAQDKLSLDADVNEYLRSWQPPNRAGQAPVTIRHLLCHADALTVSGFPGYAQGAPRPSLTEILDGLPPSNTPAVRRDGPPGLEWRYSGGGYVVLQQLLEDVAGERFAELAAGLIFRPARMTTATYDQPAFGCRRRAHKWPEGGLARLPRTGRGRPLVYSRGSRAPGASDPRPRSQEMTRRYCRGSSRRKW